MMHPITFTSDIPLTDKKEILAAYIADVEYDAYFEIYFVNEEYAEGVSVMDDEFFSVRVGESEDDFNHTIHFEEL